MSAGWKNLKYRQDMPPPGGYGSIPYKRNLPIKGPSGYLMFGVGVVVTLFGVRMQHWKQRVQFMQQDEDGQAELALSPLLEAEGDRAVLRDYKENIESEALNIVGTGLDSKYIPGHNSVYHNPQWERAIMINESPMLEAIFRWYNGAGVERLGP